MVFSFLCNGVIFGIINSSGVLFVYLKKGYKGDEDEAATKVKLINCNIVNRYYILNKRTARLLIFEKFSYLQALSRYLHIY